MSLKYSQFREKYLNLEISGLKKLYILLFLLVKIVSEV